MSVGCYSLQWEDACLAPVVGILFGIQSGCLIKSGGSLDQCHSHRY